MDPFRFEALVPPQVRAGEPVPVVLRLTNAGPERRDVYLTGREIAFDVVVAREDGTAVWRRLEGVAVQMILQVRSLAPGEALELTAEWDQRAADGAPVPPGAYLVRGILPTESARLETAPAPLRIV